MDPRKKILLTLALGATVLVFKTPEVEAGCSVGATSDMEICGDYQDCYNSSDLGLGNSTYDSSTGAANTDVPTDVPSSIAVDPSPAPAPDIPVSVTVTAQASSVATVDASVDVDAGNVIASALNNGSTGPTAPPVQPGLPDLAAAPSTTLTAMIGGASASTVNMPTVAGAFGSVGNSDLYNQGIQNAMAQDQNGGAPTADGTFAVTTNIDHNTGAPIDSNSNQVWAANNLGQGASDSWDTQNLNTNSGSPSLAGFMAARLAADPLPFASKFSNSGARFLARLVAPIKNSILPQNDDPIKIARAVLNSLENLDAENVRQGLSQLTEADKQLLSSPNGLEALTKITEQPAYIINDLFPAITLGSYMQRLEQAAGRYLPAVVDAWEPLAPVLNTTFGIADPLLTLYSVYNAFHDIQASDFNMHQQYGGTMQLFNTSSYNTSQIDSLGIKIQQK